MKYSPEITLEYVIQADPTLRYFLRETELDYDKLDHQIMVRGAAIVVAIGDYLDLKYR
jgi:hypothetical protein